MDPKADMWLDPITGTYYLNSRKYPDGLPSAYDGDPRSVPIYFATVPDAGDVGALARLLNWPVRAGDHARARSILASDWLAARDAEVRRAAGEQIAQSIEVAHQTADRCDCTYMVAAHIAREVTR
jgi:hypothetical protein